jgi:hypothetical protein
MDSNRFIEFLDIILKNKKDKLIVLDNGGMHKTKEVKDKIINSGNKYLFLFKINIPNRYNFISIFFQYF